MAISKAKSARNFTAQHIDVYRKEGMPAFKRLVAIKEGVIKVGEPLPFQYDLPPQYVVALEVIDKLWR